MGIEDIRKTLADMTADISNVQTAITETSEASDSLTQKIAGLASANTKAGSVWSVIGRMSSGSGLYDIQNKTRSIAFLFKVKQNFDKDRIKNENRINEILSNGIKRREKLFKITKLANIDEIKALTKGKLLHDDTLKLQMKQFGFAEAVTKEAFRANKALEESVLSEASTLDARDYGRRADKGSLFNKLGGPFGGNLGERQDMAVGIDSKTDELNEQLDNLKQIRILRENTRLEREKVEDKLQENYNKKERAKELKASLAKEKNVKIESTSNNMLLDLKELHIEEERKRIANLDIENEVSANKIKALKILVEEARLKAEPHPVTHYRSAEAEEEYALSQKNLAIAQRDILEHTKLRETMAEQLAKLDAQKAEIEEERTKEAKILRTRRAKQKGKIRNLEKELLNNQELSLADEQELREELSAQKEIQQVITQELTQSEDLIKAYNGELNILINAAEDSGKVIVDRINTQFGIDKNTGEIREGSVETTTRKGNKLSLSERFNPKKMFERANERYKEKTGKEGEPNLKTFVMDKLGIDKRKISNIFKFAKLGFALFGKVLLIITGIGVLVYMAKRLGIFDKISEAYDFLVTSGIIDDIKETFSELIGGVSSVLGGLFDLATALFSGGENGSVMEALSKILGGLWTVVSKTLELTLKLLVASLGSIAFSIVNSAISNFKSFLNTWSAEGPMAALGMVLEFFAKRILFTVVASAVGAGIGFFFGGPPGAILGAKAGGIVGGIAAAMEAGNYLVGENGPAIISLPGNTTVHNNNNTQRMLGSSINVTVQGRVGASDQELNDIARKIGQKVSLEMNRYSNSGYRG